MIAKSENCLYCGEKMESKTAKKKFCSTLHRVYYHRELKRGTLLLPKVGEVISNAMPVVNKNPAVVTKRNQHNHSLTLTVNPVKEEIPRLKGEGYIEYQLRMIELSENTKK